MSPEAELMSPEKVERMNLLNYRNLTPDDREMVLSVAKALNDGALLSGQSRTILHELVAIIVRTASPTTEESR